MYCVPTFSNNLLAGVTDAAAGSAHESLKIAFSADPLKAIQAKIRAHRTLNGIGKS